VALSNSDLVYVEGGTTCQLHEKASGGLREKTVSFCQEPITTISKGGITSQLHDKVSGSLREKTLALAKDQ
jgi:hypothetical protein